MKALLGLMVGLLFLPVLAGCNTMEGLGQDVQHGGEAVEDSAERNKNY